MSNLIWKIKRFFSGLVPYAIAGLLLYGGYNLYKKGTFRAFRYGVGHGVTAVLKQVPFFGKKFGKYSYAYSGKHYKQKRKHHRGKRHNKRHHRRHR